ncbi:MAG: hypothetical protein JOY99_09020 [Sphingomonadaceae bacterium]|nr:hypothetical protein [Sphingomonadaceae bacterium]
MKLGIGIAAALLLAGCGKVYDLKPAEGHALPAKPAESLKAPTVDQLIAPPSQARPERVDDLLHRSEERRDDKFDLPPPG